MADADRGTEISETPQAKRSGSDGAVRPLLWLLLVIGLAANIVTQSMDISVLVSIGAGLVTVSCGIALAADHYRRRRR